MRTGPGLIVYRFGADLFYANDPLFVDEVRRLIDGAPTPVHCVVVASAAIADLDYSAGRSIETLCGMLAQRGVRLVFGRVNRHLRSDMDRHGITPVIGTENIYMTLHAALAAVRPDLPMPGES